VGRREPLPRDLDLKAGGDELGDLVAVRHEPRRLLDRLSAGEPIVQLGGRWQRRRVARQ
jgi:hypothetical protein